MDSTKDDEYADRLYKLQTPLWKKFIPNPYRWYFRRLDLGRFLEPGCGIGRVLAFRPEQGVGVDHNEKSIDICRQRGFTAYTSDEFLKSADAKPESFDSLVCAHLMEHLTEEEGNDLLRHFLQFVKPGGRVLLITPQEWGYRSDPTHIRWSDFDVCEKFCREMGLDIEKQKSFPFPRMFGKLFIYNEFITLARKPK